MWEALFVPFAPSLAHVSRCLAVAEAWRARGHRAVFAVGQERMAMVQDAGFEAHALPEVTGHVFRSDRGLRWLTAVYVQQNLETEEAILVDIEPDVVVFDFRFTSALAARRNGRPSVSILHGNALRLAQQPREMAKLLISGPQDRQGTSALRQRILQRLFPLVFLALQRAMVRRIAGTLRNHHYPRVDSPFALLLADRILLADITGLMPAHVPSNCHIVGPLLWRGWDQAVPWLDELSDRPCIYVTMGSTVEAGSGLVKIIDALRGAPYNAIVSTGSLSLPPDLDLPPHVRVFPIVPGAAVARHSAAVVHPGGHGTLMQALAAGVPSLMLPVNPDQILVAKQAQALGVAHSLWRADSLPYRTRLLEEIGPGQIRDAIDGLLADRNCRRACQALQEEIETFDGAAAAVALLEGTVQERRD
jgi:UDP:flavonoid glycosyltransferase YjiC (YdhE family)